MDRAQPDVSPEPLFELLPLPGIALGKRLRLVQDEVQVAIFLGGTVIDRFDADDDAARAACMASLVHSGLATQREVAVAFGRHRNTVWRLSTRFAHEGLAAVVPAKRGPKGPSKVTPQVLQVVAEHAGLPATALQALVHERAGVGLSLSHLRFLRQAHGSRSSELLLAPQPGPAPQPVPPAALEAVTADRAPGPEPPAVVPEVARGRYLGAALYYPALQALGLLEAARSCFRLPNSERFGVRAITLTLFFLSLFGKTTPEAAKHLRRAEFGPLVGSGRAPAVKTLRRKLAALVAQGQASRFGELLARRWVDQGLLASAYLYVDGHMQAYTGKRRLAEVWNAQRRMPLPGLLTYFVNDGQARPLLFVTEEANASLAAAMPRVVAAIRTVLGARPFTVIFDRGGYDGGLFRWLREQGIDFITYQRGEPGLPTGRFRRRECRFEGRRVRMALAEDAVTVGGSGPWRRIVLRTKTGHQTPILTSLGPELRAARIASLMFARWRQENFFRYMREHHGLDRLLGYAFAEADGARLVPNPERKRLEHELRERRRQLAALRAGLGQAVLDEPRDGSRTAHALKIAQGGVVGRMRALEAEIDALAVTRRATPERVPLAQAGRRQVLRLEQKAIIDRIKLTAYNAEEWLLERLVHHYPNPHDGRALLRSFAELSGEVRRTAGRIVVTLDAPDTPLHQRALRGLCEDLNLTAATFPGTDLPVTYRVAVHLAEAAA